jgi:hypothetical protein
MADTEVQVVYWECEARINDMIRFDMECTST